MSFIRFCIYSGLPPAFFIAIISSIIIILFFLLKLPKITLIGELWMLIILVSEKTVLSKTYLTNDGVALPPYYICIGFYIMLIATIVCVICAFVGNKKNGK